MNPRTLFLYLTFSSFRTNPTRSSRYCQISPMRRQVGVRAETTRLRREVSVEEMAALNIRVLRQRNSTCGARFQDSGRRATQNSDWPNFGRLDASARRVT